MAADNQFQNGELTDDLYQDDNNEEQMDTIGSGGDASTEEESPDARKLFIGGLNLETTAKDIKQYFGKYGEVAAVNIKTDVTGMSRGFAFIVFATKDPIDAVFKAGPITIHGKQVDIQKAKARPGIKKIFVGGLDPDYPEANIRAYFEKFGKIEEVELPFDKTKKQRRKFIFITFESESIVNEICKNGKHTIDNKECDVKRAFPQQQSDTTRGGWGPPIRGRGRGRGRGGPMARGGFNPGFYGFDPSWMGYDGYGGYDGWGYGPYDYSAWGPGYVPGYRGGYGPQVPGFGKTRRARGGGFHPYSR